MAAPYDIDGEFCGYGDRKDYPNLYWPSIIGDPKKVLNEGVCVKLCPTNGGAID